MQQRYFVEPYRFVPPHRGRFWLRVFRPAYWWFANQAGVHRIEIRGVDRLRASLERRAGVVLAANHSCSADMPVLSKLGLEAGTFLFFLASYHVFMQSRRVRWMSRRLGGLSILREGADRESLRECTRIVADGERPLAIFPEGTWTRQNDRLGPIQEGASLILRQAEKKGCRPVVLHPVATRYWCLEDPRPAISRRLARLETALRWGPQGDRGLVDRLLRLNEAYLAIKEIEYFGAARVGDLDERIRSLAEHLIAREEALQGALPRGRLLERIRGLRPKLLKLLQSDEASRTKTFQRFDDLLTAELLYGQDQRYLTENPTFERLCEGVLRTEEDLFDTEVPLCRMGAVVEVGEAMSPAEFPRQRSEVDPLMAESARWTQASLETMRRAGPPREWPRPPQETPK